MFDFGNTYDVAFLIDDADLSHNLMISNGHVSITNGEISASHNPLQYCNVSAQEAETYCRSHITFGAGQELMADIYNSALTGIELNIAADKKLVEAHFAINPMQALPIINQTYPDVQVHILPVEDDHYYVS
ncbi:hypothetical protein [Anaplasma capra]|uniref:hypothetical protein n=1 Tax=Anaplasma capra TaxID=1562740 RepID=UPI0021D5F24E|nr:hypothetical protein [Anaplasma capra]MCU7611240.1 hypothetical protein [Anaplasma capra]MCU7612612.1 hypothetical protein [Anaplasma capra]